MTIPSFGVGNLRKPPTFPATEAEQIGSLYPVAKHDLLFSEEQELMELVAFTRPEIYENLISDKFELPYQHILALWHSDGVFGQHLGRKDTSGLYARTLQLPFKMGVRLLQGMRATMDPNQSVNCHYFGRIMSGHRLDHDAPFLASEGVKTESPLALGQLGLVASLDEYPTIALLDSVKM